MPSTRISSRTIRMPTPHDLGVATRVREQMERLGFTGTKLAAAVGHNQQWISRRLTGEIKFGVADLVEVAEVLGVPVAELVAA